MKVHFGYLIKIGIIFLSMSFDSLYVEAQQGLTWKELPALPDTVGRAGMFTGVSGGNLFCMGGANFPNGYPWEGGKKVWHNDIFMLDENNEWQLLGMTLPTRLAYGVSVSYDNQIIVVGGSDENNHYSHTLALAWNGAQLDKRELPQLPHSLANMAGALVGHVIVVIGGMEAPVSEPVNACYLLDLEQLELGWVKAPSFPGERRVFPVAASDGKSFFVFSGENTKRNAFGTDQRHILQDAYRFDFDEHTKMSGTWCRLAAIPKGFSAGASPAPFIESGFFLLWGGVDRITALHTDASSHPGIPNDILNYYPDSDMWGLGAGVSLAPGRVTLTTVVYNGYTYYINGEVKPGIRTNRLIGVALSMEED